MRTITTTMTLIMTVITIVVMVVVMTMTTNPNRYHNDKGQYLVVSEEEALKHKKWSNFTEFNNTVSDDDLTTKHLLTIKKLNTFLFI